MNWLIDRRNFIINSIKGSILLRSFPYIHIFTQKKNNITNNINLNKSVADEYNKYVNEMIPASFEIAKQDSIRRESAIFSSGAAAAQISLVKATDFSISFSRLLNQLSDPQLLVNPDGSLNINIAVEQYLLYSQLVTTHQLAIDNINDFKKLYETLKQSADKGFENYSFSWLQMQFAREEVELFDGVYPIIIYTGEGTSTVIISAIVSLILSVWTIIGNLNEQDRIDKDAERLKNESAKDTNYQSFAKEAAQTIQKSFEPYFLMYELIANSLDNWYKVADKDNLIKRKQELRSLFNTYSYQQINEIKNIARDRLRIRFGEKSENEAHLNIEIATNIRIAQRLQKLKALKCSEGNNLVEAIRADFNLAEVISLQSTLKMESQYNEWLLTREENCKVNDTFFVRSFFNKIKLQNKLSQLLKVSIKTIDQFGYLSPNELTLFRQPRINFAVDQPIITGACLHIEGYGSGSLCNNLHTYDTIGEGDIGMHTSSSGGFCQSSSSMSYSFCPSGLMPYANDFGPWTALRTVIAANGHLPGQYQAVRGAAAGERLEKALNYVKERTESLKNINVDLADAQSNYFKKTLSPAINQTTQTIGIAEQDVNTKLIPNLTHPIPLVNDDPDNSADHTLMELASSSVRQYITETRNNEGKSMQLWIGLNPLYSVVSESRNFLPETDIKALDQLYDNYFNSQGLLNSYALGIEWGAVADEMSLHLDTSRTSYQGRKIRDELNRGLSILADNVTSEVRSEVTGAIAMIKGADIAFSQGFNDDGQRLYKAGTMIMDFALGLTPLSSLNDAIQIIYGVATGRDYSGNIMTAADFALRGIGVAIGFIPGAGASLQIAGKTISRTFEEGCLVLSKLNLRTTIHEYFLGGRIFVNEFVKTVGEVFPLANHNLYDIDRLTMKVNSLLLFEKDLINGTSRQMIEDIWLKLREGGQIFDEGAVKLFDDRTFTKIELPSDEVFARVVPRQFSDEIIQGVRPLSTSNEAFITAAEDLKGMTNSNEIAQRLGLYNDAFGTVLHPPTDSVILQFKFNAPGLVSPVNFDFPHLRQYGWIYGGLTKGGAREWIINSNAVKDGKIIFTGTPINILP